MAARSWRAGRMRAMHCEVVALLVQRWGAGLLYVVATLLRMNDAGFPGT